MVIRTSWGTFDLPKGVRDAALFLGGFIGIMFEAVHEKADRPYLIAAFLGMMGLPKYLRKDEEKSDDTSPKGPRENKTGSENRNGGG